MTAARNGWRFAAMALGGMTFGLAACQAFSHSDDFGTRTDASVPQIVFVEGGTTTIIIDGGTVIIDSGVECPTGESLCTAEGGAPRCADTTSESLNCGACNVACPQTQACDAGSCACPGGTTSCAAPALDGGGDAGTTCVNTTNDPSNCGGCGIACGNEHICQGGNCIATCPTNTTNCSEDCVDITSDGTNCGACGANCGGGGCETAFEDAAVVYKCCGDSCKCDLPKTICGVKCVDTNINADNCGKCGYGCGSGQGCDGGACFCTTAGQTLCGSTCTNCPTNGACSGEQCVCPVGTSLSNGICCPAGQTGSDGICCPNGEVNLNGSGVCCEANGTVDAGACCTQNGNICCPNGQVACSLATMIGNPSPTPTSNIIVVGPRPQDSRGGPVQIAHSCTTPDTCTAAGRTVIQ